MGQGRKPTPRKGNTRAPRRCPPYRPPAADQTGFHALLWAAGPCATAWQAACRLATGTRGDCQSPRRMPSCPTEIAPFLTVAVLVLRARHPAPATRLRVWMIHSRVPVGDPEVAIRRSPGVAASAVAKSCPKTSTVFAPRSSPVLRANPLRRGCADDRLSSSAWQATENDGLPYGRFFCVAARQLHVDAQVPASCR